MGFWRLPEQRLGIDVSVNVAIEARIDMNPMRLFPSEAGHDVSSVPIRRAVIIQDRLSTGHRTEQKSCANGTNEPEMTNSGRHGPPAFDGLLRKLLAARVPQILFYQQAVILRVPRGESRRSEAPKPGILRAKRA